MISSDLDDNVVVQGRKTLSQRTLINVGAGGPGTTLLIAGVPFANGVAAKKIRVLAYLLIVNPAVNATFESELGTLVTGPLPLATTGGIAAAVNELGWFDTLPGEGLSLHLDGATQASGHLNYVLL